MKPDDIRQSQLGQAASKAHAAADSVYQALTRPDRPIEPDPHKKPWLAALLSFFVVGAGQLYNRQLIKAVVLFGIFYLIGLVLLIAYLLLALWEAAQQTRADLAYVVMIIWTGLWLVAVIDAYRIARLLRSGTLVVRYGFVKQGLYAAAGMIPFAGVMTPQETVAPDEVNKRVGEVAIDVAKERLLKWLVIRALRYGCLGLGAVVVLIGLIAQLHLLLTLGSLIILAGILLFLV